VEALLRQGRTRLRSIAPAIGRVGILRHDPGSGLLRPSLGQGTRRPFGDPEAIALASRPDLIALGQRQQMAIVDDRTAESDGGGSDAPWSPDTAWRSRLTMPLLRGKQLLGFLVIHADGVAVFHPEALEALRHPLELLRFRIIERLGAIADLHTSLRLLQDIVALRDAGTGGHLERVAGYCLLIGRELERQLTLPSGFADAVARFAPLHDLGKLGIPDRVLLKPGMLDPMEIVLMRTHVTIGQALIEQLLRGLQLDHEPTVQWLREVVGQHHECLDGSGYPLGLRGEQVGLAGRIVAVADIYDSLTQARPYKHALADGLAAEILRGLVRGGKLDGRSVEALMGQDEQRRLIREGESLTA
jgi:HD-GYP domain-containing protein (c-di-GMP phosphodiesterase class II)